MDGAPASDKSLLERLNALKPSPIRLTSSSSSKPNPASTIERSKSPSREDALKARLQSLRNQGSESKDSTTVDQHRGVGQSTLPLPAQDNGPLTRELGIQPTPTPNQVTDDVDPLLYTDDQTLEELLEDLRADDFWLEEVAAEEEEHQRVTALLTELGNSSSVSAGADRRNANQDGSWENSEDNSDGDGDSEEEIAAAEIDSVLAKAIDELEWENANKTSSPPPQPVPASPTTGEQNSVDGGTQGPNDSPL
ncbi:hypothetical protein NUW58_g9971 [Xylaria curta]|uniref:Uncharacterized protein n=1 Tax=Xylaria curta TaxID=42375 RepID=A0ACC1MTD6_9PEZI|nr:hypothetical protein NUW58_g9971 [Xylaria curta]